MIEWNGHTLIVDDSMYKWDGHIFHVYKVNPATMAYELKGTDSEPTIKRWQHNHTMKLYMKNDKIPRIFVFSEYTAENKLDYIDYPIVYQNGNIAWDFPNNIPDGIRKRYENIMKKLYKAGLFDK